MILRVAGIQGSAEWADGVVPDAEDDVPPVPLMDHHTTSARGVGEGSIAPTLQRLGALGIVVSVIALVVRSNRKSAVGTGNGKFL